MPFHLVSSIIRSDAGAQRFQLVTRPSEGDSLQRAEEDYRLAAAVQLPVGRTLSYTIREAGGARHEEELRVEASLLGQMRLRVENGASVAFEHHNSTLAFYDRQGKRDPLLDLWCLALGLTPLASGVAQWSDAPPMRLLPMNAWQRLMLGIMRPLGAGMQSRYSRRWIEDQGIWRQVGEHTLRIALWAFSATTTADLNPDSGCVDLTLECGAQRWQAELTRLGQVADRGIPRWQADIESENGSTDNPTGDAT